MKIIKRIINWIINWFRKIFGKKKVTKKIKNNINDVRNKRYLKGYGINIEEMSPLGLPLYLMIDDLEKNILIDRIKMIESVIPNIDSNEELVKKIEICVNKIEKNSISIYQNEKITEMVENILNDRKIEESIEKKVNDFYCNLSEIIDNFDKSIQDRVEKEYQEVNFVTVSTLILDETIREINTLEENYKKHKYNKYYYEREVYKIKERIKNLKKVYDSIKVREEIELLRKSLYTKSKDKYDLLYNNEIFLNIEKKCDDLVDRVNRKVIDIKINKKETKDNEKKEEVKENDNTLENIIKRFKDLELARKILLLNRHMEYDIGSVDKLLSKLNNIYYDFISGERFVFNFERNKIKTELVKMYNDLNIIDSFLNNKEIIFLDHINYRMDELLDAVIDKKESIENLLNDKIHYEKEKNEESILVDNKLNILLEKEYEKNQIKAPSLIKKINNIYEKK